MNMKFFKVSFCIMLINFKIVYFQVKFELESVISEKEATEMSFQQVSQLEEVIGNLFFKYYLIIYISNICVIYIGCILQALDTNFVT